MKNVGVFCASSNRMEQVYYDAAQRLGRWIGESGRTLVYGGCSSGLMEATAKAVHENGGRVLGVVPEILKERGRVSSYIDEIRMTKDLDERKRGLIEAADVILALPGSVGTLDEIFTVLSANTIGLHDKKVVLWNINGFWDDLLALFHGLEKRNVVNKPFEEFVFVADTWDELVNILENWK